MSFLPSPARFILFFAKQPNTPPGGETPLSDFSAVWEDLRTKLKDKSELTRSDAQVRNIRMYHSEARLNMNPLSTKTWQMMFSTKDK